MAGYSTNSAQNFVTQMLPYSQGNTSSAAQTVADMLPYSSGGPLEPGSYNNPNPVDTAAAAARARANSQISSINSLLGLIGTKRDQGIGDINSGAAEQQRRLAEQKQATMTGYDNQSTQNLKDRTRGYEQVDDFANSSAKSLGRVFQGATVGADAYVDDLNGGTNPITALDIWFEGQPLAFQLAPQTLGDAALIASTVWGDTATYSSGTKGGDLKETKDNAELGAIT